MGKAFFALAMLSPGRQSAFRRAVLAHLILVAAGAGSVCWGGSPVFLGQSLLIAGIVEGAVLIGWRLTQLPKSQALEFLLVSPLQPGRFFLAEAAVGLGRLALVTLSGLPILLGLTLLGRRDPVDFKLSSPGLIDLDLAALMVMPFTWGAITGLGLTTWAYEPLSVRRWGERGLFLLILLYLVVGVLAGEHLGRWVNAWLPEDLGWLFLRSFEALHRYNPFAVLQTWLEDDPEWAWEAMLALELGAVAVAVLLMFRAGRRLKPHFHERHYRPILERPAGDASRVGNRPLSWWAVRRVMEYSGRVNLWLAGGFGVLYAIYTVAGPSWPDWLGRRVFDLVEHVGGIPVLATGLVILSAVPAAFQYGLWDSNAQDRCRRLELLLLTELVAKDYWEAAAAAAWRRGRGYFTVAVILWTAALIAGKATAWQMAAALAASAVLWGLYFAVGFRAFSRGMQANGLGTLLTIGVPLLAVALSVIGLPAAAALLPPGSIYAVGTKPLTLALLPGPLLGAVGALIIARFGLNNCQEELRRWYELHHGRKVID